MQITNKIYVYLLIALTTGSLCTLQVAAQDSITTSVTLSSSGNIQSTPTSNFIIKAADTALDTICPSAASYEANWSSTLSGLGVNTLRLQEGGEGDVWGINMINNPNTWAVNLENLLNEIGNASFRCYFYSLGDPWGGELGINDQAANISATISVTQAESYINELAGNNSLNHDFITDPRIALWSVGNEVNFGSSSDPNSNYYWVIQICDYIRSLGGLVDVPSPIVNGQYCTGESLLTGHVDFLEIHQYGLYQLATQYALGNNQYNWTAWESWLQSDLAASVTNLGPFDINHVILGEFGIWLGTGSDQGLTNYTFTDQNRVDYYTNFFQAVNAVGFENVCFHYSIEENSQYGKPEYCRYGMITPVPDGLHFTAPGGQLDPGCEVIEANFG